MSVMRIYWSQALARPLAAFVDEIRTLPLSRHGGARNVGWDMPCENLNRDIKDDIKGNSGAYRFTPKNAIISTIIGAIAAA